MPGRHFQRGWLLTSAALSNLLHASHTHTRSRCPTFSYSIHLHVPPASLPT